MLTRIKRELERLTERGRERVFAPRTRRAGAVSEIRGATLIDFTNWDIFGLGNHPRICKAFISEIERDGVGGGASRMLSGTTDAHLLAERRVASFFGSDASLLFSSKNQATFSLISALAGEGDVVLCDEMMQSPVADAAHLVQSDLVYVSVEDVQGLTRELERERLGKTRFVVVESLSPVTGRYAPIVEIAAVCKKFGVFLIVDETYAIGVSGPHGQGLLGESKVKPFAVYASLGYGGGAPVGVVAGDAVLIRYLVQRSKTFVLEPATLPVLARGVVVALDCIEESTRARVRVQAIAQRIRSTLGKLGYLPAVVDTLALTHIVTIPFTNRTDAERFSSALFKKGVLVEVVWAGKALSELCYVRIIPTDLHTDEQIDFFLQACADVTRVSVSS